MLENWIAVIRTGNVVTPPSLGGRLSAWVLAQLDERSEALSRSVSSALAEGRSDRNGPPDPSWSSYHRGGDAAFWVAG